MFNLKFKGFLFVISILMIVSLFGCSSEGSNVSEDEKVVVGYPDSSLIKVGSTNETADFGKTTYVKIEDVNETLSNDDFKGTFKEVRISDYEPDGQMTENLKDIDVNSIVEVVLTLENITDEDKTFNKENIQLLINDSGEVINYTQFSSGELFEKFQENESKEENLIFYVTTDSHEIEKLSVIIPSLNMENDVVFEIDWVL